MLVMDETQGPGPSFLKCPQQKDDIPPLFPSLLQDLPFRMTYVVAGISGQKPPGTRGAPENGGLGRGAAELREGVGDGRKRGGPQLFFSKLPGSREGKLF